MQSIKLVIWDLDDTFWEGTLSEGKITPNPYHIEVVKTLVDRGIMNSISSKNNFQDAQSKLVELGIWDLFIFPHISWEPKGKQIESIINQTQLRAVNVLFIDDNHSNIEEAKFYNHDINAGYPSFIGTMLDLPSFKGKNDIDHSRLLQYKLLEEKQIEKQKFSDNQAFLESSGIVVSLIEDVLTNRDRVAELLERTNQLNFTKLRPNENELTQLLQDDAIEKRLISVKDRFGDYGIVGFYALDKNSHKLLHFLFSCRILNLGVEQFIYARLHFPGIDINGEVIGQLNKTDSPDWIELGEYVKENDIPGEIDSKRSDTIKKPVVFFKGGCDLSQMLFYVKGHFQIQEELNYVMRNNLPMAYEHTDILLQVFNKKLPRHEKIPFLDNGIFNTKVFDFKYDALLYSVLSDYTQVEYRHQSGYLLPHRGYLDITLDANKEEILSIYRKDKVAEYDEKFLENFKRQFVHVGVISPERFLENLAALRKIIPQNIPIIFINGSEQAIDNPLEIGAQKRHIQMNKALDSFIAAHQNCFLLDVRQVVTTPGMHTSNIRHYNRMTYVKMAEILQEMLSSIFNQSNLKKKRSVLKNLVTNSDTLYKYLVQYPDKAKEKIKRMSR